MYVNRTPMSEDFEIQDETDTHGRLWRSTAHHITVQHNTAQHHTAQHSIAQQAVSYCGGVPAKTTCKRCRCRASAAAPPWGARGRSPATTPRRSRGRSGCRLAPQAHDRTPSWWSAAACGLMLNTGAVVLCFSVDPALRSILLAARLKRMNLFF